MPSPPASRWNDFLTGNGCGRSSISCISGCIQRASPRSRKRTSSTAATWPSYTLRSVRSFPRRCQPSISERSRAGVEEDHERRRAEHFAKGKGSGQRKPGEDSGYRGGGTKLKDYGLVAPRRDAQTIYYRLTEHDFNYKLRENFFREFERCFPGWTRVAILDEVDRPISELRPGDLVCSWDGRRGALVQGRITRAITGTATRLIRVNGSLMATPEHRILTARGYVQFDEMRIGDLLFRFPGTETQEVREIEVVQGETLVYNLEVSPCASFFAEGLAVEDYTGENLLENGDIEKLNEVAVVEGPQAAVSTTGRPRVMAR